MRAGTPRHAFAIGLAASVLLHLLLFVVNPGWLLEGRWPAQPSPQWVQHPVPSGPALTVTEPRPPGAAAAAEPVADAAAAAARPSAADSLAGDIRPAPASTPGARSLDPAERLRYRPGPVWFPPPRAEESPECAPIDINAALAQAIAEGRYPLVPAPADPWADRRSVDIPLLRIPFGKKPPPPPVGLPAPPPPDSLRADSLRRDSVATGRAASPAATRPGCPDTTSRLRPRLRRDTIWQ